MPFFIIIFSDKSVCIVELSNISVLEDTVLQYKLLLFDINKLPFILS